MSGTSALAVVISRPGTRAMWGSGRKSPVSTPTGTTDIRSRSTPIWAAMSPAEDSETVSTLGMRCATRFCMRTKAYQRRTLICRRQPSAWLSSRARSTVIG